MFWIIPVVLLSSFVLSGPIMSGVEQAPYTVIRTDGDYEIREYAPSIVAETETTGDRQEAIREGFRTIADYIFGNNETNDKVAMTAPVVQESSQKIALTSLVSQEESDGKWKVRFVMPAEYSLNTLPKPNNPKVQLIPMPARQVATIRFSGAADDVLLQEKEADLIPIPDLSESGIPLGIRM